MEIWKTVIVNDEVYENYMVSNLGNVKSLYNNRHKIYREKILKPHKDGNGYLMVNLCGGIRKMKSYRIHKLVSNTFIPNPNKFPQVNHKDENKENNCVENLEWCNAMYNTNYGTRNKRASESRKGTHPSKETRIKLSEARKGEKNHNSKKVICLETREIFTSGGEASRQLKVNVTSISRVCRGKRKQTGKLTFRYLDQVLFYN